jgi:hypothetical protein
MVAFPPTFKETLVLHMDQMPGYDQAIKRFPV